MSGTTISNAAMDVLRDEPAKAIALYAYLCRHVDYKTGVVGAVRRISYQSMREWLSVPATAGRAAESCTKASVQSLLRRLEGVGLISDMGNCVFLLKYELAHHSVSRRLILGKYEDDSNIAINNNDLTGRLIRGDSEVATPLINQSINQARAKFEMSYSWVPSADFLDLARVSMLDVAEGGKHRELMLSALGEFRLYWMGREPVELRNQQAWERSFLQTLIRQKSQPQPSQYSGGYTNEQPGKRKSGGRQLSAAERNAEQARQWQQQAE